MTMEPNRVLRKPLQVSFDSVTKGTKVDEQWKRLSLYKTCAIRVKDVLRKLGTSNPAQQYD
jgi:hypothetical protein